MAGRRKRRRLSDDALDAKRESQKRYKRKFKQVKLLQMEVDLLRVRAVVLNMGEEDDPHRPRPTREPVDASLVGASRRAALQATREKHERNLMRWLVTEKQRLLTEIAGMDG